MIYVTSDLHGCDPQRFFDLLKSVGFSKKDFLFILGDVIDRGKNGVALLRWITAQDNVELLLGNHEAFLLACEFIFDVITEENLGKLDAQKLNILSSWLANGATSTLADLQQLSKDDPQILRGILDYLHEAPLYEEISVNGKDYILTHAGLGNFDPQKKIEDYTSQELLWTRPSPDTRYYENKKVIFGHTPTEYFGEEYRGKPVCTDSWICIDTGAGSGFSPVLLRLDDEKIFCGAVEPQ